MKIQHLVFLFFLSCAGLGINSAQSAEVSLSPSFFASGTDNGPADRVFDWNGFAEVRVIGKSASVV